MSPTTVASPISFDDISPPDERSDEPIEQPLPGCVPARPWLPWIALGVVLGALSCATPGNVPAAERLLPLGLSHHGWALCVGLPLLVLAVVVATRMRWAALHQPVAARWLALLACGFLGAGLAAGFLPRPGPTTETRLIALRGTVSHVAWQGAYGDGLRVAVDAVELPFHAELPPSVFVRGPAGHPVRVGDAVRVRGVWTRDARGVRIEAQGSDDLALLTPREHGPRGFAWAALERIDGRRELASDLLIGQGAPPEADDFRRSGLLHILAVSGMHLALAAVLGAFVLRSLGLGWWQRHLALAALVGGYVWLTAGSPATLRALVMHLVIVAAALLARDPHRLTAVCLAALVLVLFDPGLVGDAGFQLSLVAVLGIVTLGMDLVRLRQRFLPLKAWPLDRPSWRGLLWSARTMSDGLCVGIAASLATAPVLAWWFGTMNPWGALATLVASPFATAALWLGLPLLALGGLWPDGPWEGLYRLVEFNLDALAGTAHYAAALPGATIKSVSWPIWLLVLWPALFAAPQLRRAAIAVWTACRPASRSSPAPPGSPPSAGSSPVCATAAP